MPKNFIKPIIKKYRIAYRIAIASDVYFLYQYWINLPNNHILLFKLECSILIKRMKWLVIFETLLIINTF